MDVTCKNCGNVFGDYMTICPSCGTPVEPVSEETATANPEPEVQVQPEAQQPEAQPVFQQPEAQPAYQQQAYQQQAYQQQPYQQQPYQQQPYQQQAYQQQPYQQQAYQQPYQQPYQTGAPVYNPNMMGQQKSKLVAGLLGIFLGGLGVHNFYLGFSGKAVIQIVVSLITCGLGSIWGLIEGIMILAGSINVDANGIPLGE